MVLKLDSCHLQTIVAHAESTYPEECCGLLLGTVDATGTTIVVVKSADNAWAESAHKNRRYEIAPEVMLAAIRESRDRNLAIVGIYHSHPDQPAVPSECDRQLAWQHYSYVIVSVKKGSAIDGRSWRLDANHQFQPEEILALLNNDMNLPPNPPFWGTLGLSKSLTCGGFRGRSRKVATHRFILGFSNAEVSMPSRIGERMSKGNG